MARGDEPLLSHRTSTDQSDSRVFSDEEDSIYTSKATLPAHAPRKRWRETIIFVWALLATATVLVLAVLYERQTTSPGSGSDNSSKPAGKRNLIFMVSDGMGPSSLSLTRSTWQHMYEMPYNEQLVLDKHLIGQSRTRSTSSLITDSAAGATAFSCGHKSYNGAISVLPDHSPCGTVLEAAKLAGYKTGLVVTTRLTDATPATFASHVRMRDEEDRIAEQLLGDQPLGHMVDLLMGGGRCHFTPHATEGSCRSDEVNLVAKAKRDGYHYVSDRAGFDGLNSGANVQLPLLGLFADLDIPYEIDRRVENDTYPSLAEMASTAMRVLSDATKDSDKGFFLLIEGSRIDHAGHANDPVAQVHEVLSYDAAMASVIDFLDNDSTEGVMVSTSDHETGGLADARQLNKEYPEYLWYPGVLTNASSSAEKLAEDYHEHIADTDPNDISDTGEPDKMARGPTDSDLFKYLTHLVSDGLGIDDASDNEIQLLIDDADIAAYTFADMVSRRAEIGWSTHGHSAADVNIYGYSSSSSSSSAISPLRGNHENTEVGKFLHDYLAVDVDAVTRKLRKAKDFKMSTKSSSSSSPSSSDDGSADQGGGNGDWMWMGNVPEEGKRLDGQDHLKEGNRKAGLGNGHRH